MKAIFSFAIGLMLLLSLTAPAHAQHYLFYLPTFTSGEAAGDYNSAKWWTVDRTTGTTMTAFFKTADFDSVQLYIAYDDSFWVDSIAVVRSVYPGLSPNGILMRDTTKHYNQGTDTISIRAVVPGISYKRWHNYAQANNPGYYPYSAFLLYLSTGALKGSSAVSPTKALIGVVGKRKNAPPMY